MKSEPMTSEKRFRERYPELWEAAQAAVHTVVEEVVFLDAGRSREYGDATSVAARWFPVRTLQHNEAYDWVSAEAIFEPTGELRSISTAIVSGDIWYAPDTAGA